MSTINTFVHLHESIIHFTRVEENKKSEGAVDEERFASQFVFVAIAIYEKS